MTAYIGDRHGLGTTGNVLASSHACGLLLICHRLWNQAFVHVGVASAVSTIFVLWAEAPAQIDGNSLVLKATKRCMRRGSRSTGTSITTDTANR